MSSRQAFPQARAGLPETWLELAEMDSLRADHLMRPTVLRRPRPHASDRPTTCLFVRSRPGKIIKPHASPGHELYLFVGGSPYMRRLLATSGNAIITFYELGGMANAHVVSPDVGIRDL
jgi:alkanesulfonate monooxygenase SsuD/methylene tetrahydromethanopterin reductase-like flavin-dependent oxidoreductase (luciferase family)